jgi:L,D-transpeptidase ErfK/SrfK
MITRIVLLILICSANAATYLLPENGDIIGSNYTVTAKSGDTLSTLAYRHDVGILELQQANPKIYRLKENQLVVIPKQFILPPKAYRQGIVLSMSELRLYFFPKDSPFVMTYPVAMGREGWRTPTMKTYIVKKAADPTWHVPKSIAEHHFESTGIQLPETIGPGPENPLGPFAIYLGAKSILIHGTNNQSKVGQYVSSGCIRMYNSDVQELYKLVSKGMPVTVINHQYKLGKKGNELYLEVHKKVKLNGPASPLNSVNLNELIFQQGGGKGIRVNWDRVNASVHKPTGLPERISY